MMTFRHASQRSSRQAATPRIWTPTSSWSNFHTRQNVPRRALSNRLQSSPTPRRARRPPPTAYRSFPSNQTSANGLPSFARNLPTSSTLFQRFIAIAMGHLTRYRALMVLASSRDGATVVKTRTHPAHHHVASLGVRPFFRLWARRRWRAMLACSSDRRYAWTSPWTSPALAGGRPRSARVGLGGPRRPG